MHTYLCKFKNTHIHVYTHIHMSVHCTHTANISIPTHKRMKLLGIGGYNLRSIQDLTGVRAEMISQDLLSVFAPTKQAMEEFREIVDGIINEAVSKITIFFCGD